MRESEKIAKIIKKWEDSIINYDKEQMKFGKDIKEILKHCYNKKELKQISRLFREYNICLLIITPAQSYLWNKQKMYYFLG